MQAVRLPLQAGRAHGPCLHTASAYPQAVSGCLEKQRRQLKQPAVQNTNCSVAWAAVIWRWLPVHNRVRPELVLW